MKNMIKCSRFSGWSERTFPSNLLFVKFRRLIGVLLYTSSFNIVYLSVYIYIHVY